MIDYALALKVKTGPGEDVRCKPPARGRTATCRPSRSAASPPRPSADIYSFGITCYELACGRQPFRANSPADLLNKHLSEMPSPPTVHNKEITRVLRPRHEDDQEEARRPPPEPPRVPQPVRPPPRLTDRPDARLRRRPVALRSSAPTSPQELSLAMASPNRYRLPFEAPIHEMEARLAEPSSRHADARAGHAPEAAALSEQIRRERRELAEPQAHDLRQPRPLADRPGLAVRRPPADPRLPEPDLRPVRRASRRPRRRRRPGDRHRLRPPRRPEGHVHRPPEGEDPGRAPGVQLRLRPPRGLPQGPPQDEDGRQVPPARSSA